ncbi:nucleotidyltransferase domain-containing protein [Ralstonia pseudosolanacearum]|uniref:nucleotidyltransferase domain-containing protein n=1 Tax=Ralstonia pseudosolanacearum TaxID=1310165 RepID=UPI003C2C09EE
MFSQIAATQGEHVRVRILDRQPATTLVALSGPDNVGKTSQLRWLRRRNLDLVVFGGIHEFDPDWPLLQPGTRSDWWFSCPTKEHVAAISRAYELRAAAAKGASFAMLDRGPRMMAAVCAATHVAKEGGDIEAALAAVEREGVFADHYAAVVEILLLPSEDIQECISKTLKREEYAISSPLYHAYQEQLARALSLQSARGLYSTVLTVGNASIAAVSDRVAGAVSRLTGQRFEALLGGVDDLVVLSGMSESGKSSVGELARSRWSYCRLKIGYLADVAAARMNLTLEAFYSLSPAEMAEALLLELDRFAAQHNYFRRFSLESAHRDEVTRHWKRVLGDRMCLLYIETSESNRLDRARESIEELRARDKEKRARGVHRIKQFADHVVSNDDSQAVLAHRISQILFRRIREDDTFRPQPTATPSPLLPSIKNTFQKHVPAETLYAGIMGSLAYGGWTLDSDIDILVIVRKFRQTSFMPLAHALTAQAEGRKVALNILEESELLRSKLNGNLTHKLRIVQLGLDYRLFSSNWVPPCFARSADILASEADLVMAVTMLRRHLVVGNLSLRQVVKYCGLASKILLRGVSIDIESERSAIEQAWSHFIGGDAGSFPEDSKVLAERVLEIYRACCA